MKTGILLINKPCGVASFGVIKHFQRLLPRKTKIGHAGTLDPQANGLLIVCIGREATRLVPQFMELAKTYRVIARLGYQTDTLDTEGEAVEHAPIPHDLSQEKLQAALDAFKKGYLQAPPLYSAVKHKGVSLHKLARNQVMSTQELETITKHKAKPVTIYEGTISNYSGEHFALTATVSKGTYIRTLVDDVARACKTLATTITLERTCVGPFTTDHPQASSHEEITSQELLEERLIPTETVLTLLGR